MSITVQEFFPKLDLKSNLTQIKWSHRTNSKAALNKALNSTDIHMIEADVIAINSTENKMVPVMGHPPETTFDLTLQKFLDTVVANKTKGIKLDFKSIEAFQLGIEVVNKTTNLTQIPVWLNADIVNGPIHANGSVDAKKFLEGAAKVPQAVLSIGWTTRLEPGTTNITANYTQAQLTEMLKHVNATAGNQSVTYPVRACFVVNNNTESLKQLLEMTNSTRNPTLTVWSSEGDNVNATLLSQFIKAIGLDKVYVDVPADLYAKLDLSSSAPFSAHGSLALMIVALVASFLGSSFKLL